MSIQCPDGKGVKDILVVDGSGNQIPIKEVWLSDADKVLTKRWSKLKQLQYCVVDSDVVLELPEYTPGVFEFYSEVKLTDVPSGRFLYGTEYFYLQYRNEPYGSYPYSSEARSDSVTIRDGFNLADVVEYRHVGPNDALWSYYPTQLFSIGGESTYNFRGQFYRLTIWMLDGGGIRQYQVLDLVPVSSGGKVGLQDTLTGNIIFPTSGVLKPGPDL